MGQYLWQYAIDNEEEDNKGSDAALLPSQQQQNIPTTTMMTVLSAQAPAKLKHKLNNDVLLTEVPDDKDEVGQLYPHLCQALGLEDNGFDPTNPSIQKSMVALLTEINCLFSTEYELVIQGYGNKNVHYVPVPRASSDNSFCHSKEWLDVAIKISGSKKESTFNAAYPIANHLLHFYKDSVLAACETQKNCSVQADDSNWICCND